MTVDLTMLAWSAALTVLMVLPYVMGKTLELGLPRLAGNREDVPPGTGWIGRAERAHRNMIENLAPFAALVLIAHVTNQANDMTALGAQLFFWGRLAFAIIYLAGIPWIRTVAWAVSVVGMAIIFVEVIR